jgi:hypothetical protein
MTEKQLDRHYRDIYGITLTTYRRMKEAQDGRCAICGSTGELYVDHSHMNGRVRGLLCVRCNNGLGQFRDSVEVLHKAAEYVARGGIKFKTKWGTIGQM